MIVIEITPESLAKQHATMPYHLRCLTDGCYLATQFHYANQPDSLTPAGELHVMGTGHRVVIEGPGGSADA